MVMENFIQRPAGVLVDRGLGGGLVLVLRQHGLGLDDDLRGRPLVEDLLLRGLEDDEHQVRVQGFDDDVVHGASPFMAAGRCSPATFSTALAPAALPTAAAVRALRVLLISAAYMASIPA